MEELKELVQHSAHFIRYIDSNGCEEVLRGFGWSSGPDPRPFDFHFDFLRPETLDLRRLFDTDEVSGQVALG